MTVEADDATLPDPELRRHVLATAIRSAEACLMEHGYPEPDRALEIIAMEVDAVWAEDDELAH